jgi:hypothetical protein
MAPGAILQLQFKGIQDKFLTGNPKHNFIEQIYRQYDNFSIESIKILPSENVTFNSLITFEIRNLGDYINKLHFCFSLDPLTQSSGTFAGWTNSVGHAIIDYVDFEIGGNRIDRYYGLFMEIWNELSTLRTYADELIGKFLHIPLLQTNALSRTYYKVPLQLWFCKNIGASFPLLSLRDKSVKIIIQLKNFSDIIIYDGNTPPNQVNISDVYLLTDYIYVDDYQKNKFKSIEHVYLINQIQTAGENYIGSSNVAKIPLTFNHPCNELIFVLREIASEENNDWFNFSIRNNVINTPIQPLLSAAKLIIDGKDRECIKSSKELNTLNCSIYHTNTTDKHIYVMPFCAEPEKFYPNGTLNFSVMTSAILYYKLVNSVPLCKTFIFTRNFNWITINNLGSVKLEFSV